jgi:hypothetical protein
VVLTGIELALEWQVSVGAATPARVPGLRRELAHVHGARDGGTHGQSNLLRATADSKEPALKELESLIEQIASMRPAVGPRQLFTRELYRSLNAAKDQDEHRKSVPLSAEAGAEVKFWCEQLLKRNGKKITPPAAML